MHDDITTRDTTIEFHRSWYLTKSGIWPLVNHETYGPYVLGLIFAALIIVMILFAPSTDSHFIYTDF